MLRLPLMGVNSFNSNPGLGMYHWRPSSSGRQATHYELEHDWFVGYCLQVTLGNRPNIWVFVDFEAAHLLKSHVPTRSITHISVLSGLWKRIDNESE